MEMGNCDAAKLVNDNVGLIRKVAWRASRMYPQVEFDDFVGQGTLGAIRAANRYVEGKSSATFQTFAWKAIWGEMMELVSKSANVAKREVSLSRDYEQGGDEGGISLYAWDDLLAEYDAALNEAENADEWRKLLAPLNTRAKRVLLRIARDGWTQKMVASELGITIALVNWIVCDARERLRETSLAHMGLPPRERKHDDKRAKPVISDKGEWFPSAVRAALTFKLHHSFISIAISKQIPAAGRMWRKATPEERPLMDVAA